MIRIRNMLRKYREVIAYLLVGGTTAIVCLIVYYICVMSFLNANDPVQLQIANIIAWIIAVIYAYFANRIVVFRSHNSNMIKEAMVFCSSRITTLVLDMGCMMLLVTLLGFNDKVIKLFVQILVATVNYLLGKFLVFKKSV